MEVNRVESAIWLSGGFSTRKVENEDDNIFGTNCSVSETSDMAVIAHRGYSAEAPENTIPAIVLAAEMGYDTVECDISWTKDGVPVLLHDESVNRTARQSVNILGLEIKCGYLFKKECSDYTFEELQKFDVGLYKGKEYEGTKIPSFEEALECCKENDINMYVELKENGEFDKEKAQIIANTIIEAGMEDQVTLISFNAEYLKMMSELMPNVRIGLLCRDEPNEGTIATLESLKTGSNEVFLDVKAAKMTDEANALLDDAGFNFEAWTINNEEDLERLYDYGCQGITTDTLTDEVVSDALNLPTYSHHQGGCSR